MNKNGKKHARATVELYCDEAEAKKSTTHRTTGTEPKQSKGRDSQSRSGASIPAQTSVPRSRGRGKGEQPAKGKGKGKGGKPAKQPIPSELPTFVTNLVDAQRRWEITLAQALMGRKHFRLTGMPILTGLNKYADLFPGSSNPALSSIERESVKYLPFTGRSSNTYSVPLGPLPYNGGVRSQGARNVLVYLTPDHTCAAAVAILPSVPGQYWPTQSDYVLDPGLGFAATQPAALPWNMQPPNLQFGQLSGSDYAGSQVYYQEYMPGNNPYTEPTAQTVFDNTGCATALSCLGKARLTVTVEGMRDPQVFYMFETTPGSVRSDHESPDGDDYPMSEHAIDLNAKWSPNGPAETFPYVYEASAVRRRFGSNLRSTSSAMATTHHGEWQRTIAGPSSLPNLLRNRYSQTVSSFLPSSPPQLWPRRLVPTPYTSRGCWVAFTITGPSDRVGRFRVEVADWRGVVPSLSPLSYALPGNLQSSAYRYPRWFAKCTSCGAVGRNIDQLRLAVDGGVSSNALAHEPLSLIGALKNPNQTQRLVKEAKTCALADHKSGYGDAPPWSGDLTGKMTTFQKMAETATSSMETISNVFQAANNTYGMAKKFMDSTSSLSKVPGATKALSSDLAFTSAFEDVLESMPLLLTLI